MLTSRPAEDDARPEESSVSRGAYLILGLFALAVSLPSWALLAAGQLFRDRNPYLLLPFAAIPAGILLVLFAAGRFSRIPLSDHGFRVAILALGMGVCGLGSWLGVRAGVESLLTAHRFCATAASYLALLSFGLLTAAALRGKKEA